MKLVCDKHRHRVHVFSTPVSGKPSTKIVAVHRKDGAHCDTPSLRLGGSTFLHEQVVQSIVPVSKLVKPTDTGRKKRKRKQLVWQG